jgi:hypothetical protein
MVELEKLKRVDKATGTEVLQVWVFDLPELSYMASISVVREQNEIKELEESAEAKMRDALLSAEGKSKEMREAEASKKMMADAFFVALKKEVRDAYEKLETFKAQREYYDKMFKVVKDELYFRKRMTELELSKKIKQEVAESFGGEVHVEK